MKPSLDARIENFSVRGLNSIKYMMLEDIEARPLGDPELQSKLRLLADCDLAIKSQIAFDEVSQGVLNEMAHFERMRNPEAQLQRMRESLEAIPMIFPVKDREIRHLSRSEFDDLKKQMFRSMAMLMFIACHTYEQQLTCE